MRKAILIGALFSTATLTFATNGDNLIGLTPASRGMGGIGVGMPVGPVDSIFRNPAWMSVMENKFTVQFGGILFMPKVKAKARVPFDNNDSNAGGVVFEETPGKEKSKADMFTVPEIGIVHKISDRLTFGLGAFGVSGMGVDYRNKDNTLSGMHTSFQFMRIIPAIAFNVNDLIVVSGAIHGAWGSLDMGSFMCNDARTGDDNDRVPSRTDCWNAGGGQSQALGLGFQLGAALNFGDFLYAGLTYQSPISMTYKRVFDSDGDGQYEDMKLTQPQELAVGVGVAPLNGLKVGLDIRWINWKDAKGYKEFGWDDQIVYAIGAEYKPIDKLSLRVGYNFGSSPIDDGSNLCADPNTCPNNIPNLNRTFSDFEVAYFNLIGFPAIAEQHFTLGVGYEFTKTFSVDFSYVRAFKKTVTATSQDVDPSPGDQTLQAEAEMTQDSISIGLNWKF